ncbi:MAG: iron-only hydrogenase system regulator [Oscillospiraceae bacterium]
MALIGIIVEDAQCIEKLNQILHENREYIIGRMGIPYKNRDINVISVVVEAPNNVISSLSGKLGMLNGINVKTIYGKISNQGVEI